jgi:hypothetical protein
MRKSIMAMVAAASIAAGVVATPKAAEARCWGCWVGAGIAAGIFGGALLSSGYGYGYGYGPYYGYPASYGYPYYGGYAPYVRRYYAPRVYSGYYGPYRGYGPYAPGVYRGFYAPRRYYTARYYGRRYW